MRRTWVLWPILPLALACRDAAPTAPVALIDPPILLPIAVPLPVPVRIDLGTFGGASSYANDVNKDGTVVGSADNDAGLKRAFRWTPLGGMADLGTLPGDDWSTAFSITDDGQILGVSGSSSVSTSTGTPVVWSTGGTVTALSIPLLPGAIRGVVTDFNARGDVVGSETFASQHGWIWSEAQGKFDITANVPGGSREGGTSEIDPDGLVVGTSDIGLRCGRRPRCWHALLYSRDAGYRDIGSPGDDTLAIVTGMGLGVGPTVVGSVSLPDGTGGAYRWTEGEGFTILSGASSYATAVNTGGTAVGVAWDPALFVAQATAWPRSGGSIRLSPDDPNPTIPMAVNDLGIVVGWAAQSGGGNHATVWVLGPANGVLAGTALRPTASARVVTPTAGAAAAAVNACVADPESLVSRGALLACVNRSR